ncbi:MAG: tetratricopeptide repeat-containing sensor histidine kinase, partial [Bacteroidetes bacterium]|nr:tetratricopeptide repeat-containing sensor histidine kinase [Bacteroidota bacterium]
LRTTYMKLGVVNERYNNLDKALAYCTKAIEIGKNIHDLKNDLNLYNDVGIIYGKKGDNVTAIKWFDSALKKCDGPEFIEIKTLTLMNLGIVFDHMNDGGKALKYLNEALVLTKNSGQSENYVRINLNIASIVGKTDPQQALVSLLEGLKTARQIGQKSLQIEILDAIIEVNKKLHDYKNALTAMEERKALQDSVYGLQKAKTVANLQSLYELNKSNERVRELEIAEKKNIEQKNVIIIVALILSASLLTLVFQYRRLRMLNKQLFKREADLQKSNTEKDKLFSIIGHDLRGPIANIPQILEISNEESITHEERTFLLESLKEHSVASLDTLDKLLYWGQMQIKGLGINKVPIKAYDNIQGVLKLVKNSAEQKHILISNKVNKDIYTFADPAHFDFIIRNLIGNAIKFTNENGAIEVDANDCTHNGEIVFSIKDNGVGMSKEQQAHIFDAFSNSTLGTANERGTSLGLMLCKEFILENGGNIWVESEEGKGTTFYFSLKTSL